MTRKEEIEQASAEWQMSRNPIAIGGAKFADMAEKMNINPAFVAGAEWADKHHVEGEAHLVTIGFIGDCGRDYYRTLIIPCYPTDKLLNNESEGKPYSILLFQRLTKEEYDNLTLKTEEKP